MLFKFQNCAKVNGDLKNTFPHNYTYKQREKRETGHSPGTDLATVTSQEERQALSELET